MRVRCPKINNSNFGGLYNRFIGLAQHEDCGWVVKLPFVTNRKVFITKSLHALESYLHNWSFNSTSSPVYPYVMIQPCLRNKREYKVVHIPSQNIQYIAHASTPKYSRAFSTSPHERILQFARQAVEHFKLMCPHAITHQLFRVDIMQTEDGSLVVNEFESIDANFVPNFGASSTSARSYEFRVKTFISNFWKEQLESQDIIITAIEESRKIWGAVA
jgi:hypothetical protein